MTAFPVPPMSRLPDADDEELFEETSVKKNLKSAFDTPCVVKKRISRLSENFQQIPAEYIKVFLRVRPFTEEELRGNENQNCMKISEDRHILTVMAPKHSKMFKASSRGIGESVRHYTFTKIFDEEAGQKEFYQETAHPLVQQFINGNNALIFTYGVTNAGKTYTLQGAPGNEGIIPQAVDTIFGQIGDKMLQDVNFMPKMAGNLCSINEEEQRSRNSIKVEVMSIADESRFSFGKNSHVTLESSAGTDVSEDESGANTSRAQSQDSHHEGNEEEVPVKYAVFVSFVEVYKELVYDLLTPVGDDKRRSRPVLIIADDKKGNSYVKGMREIQVNSPQELLKIFSVGQQNLHVAATNLNKDSSRSHCIFTIVLIQVMDIPEPHGARVSKISFCDLAGSERANKTKEAGDRLKEAGKINTSLMNLGKCIMDLRHNQRYKNEKTKQRAVSFRVTKLTRLFRNYLMGDGQACMIVNANMCTSGFDETVHVLKFSAIAMEVQIINKLRRSQMKKKSNMALIEDTLETSINAVKKPRATIAWEKKLSPIKDEEVETEEDVENEDEITDESDSDSNDSDSDDGRQSVECDVSFWKNREKKFLELIEMLKKALIQEKEKGKENEASTRDQCARFMHNQIVEIERNHKDRIEGTIDMMMEEQKTRLDVMANISNITMKELKEGFEKKYWELTAKNTNMAKELDECREQINVKATALLNVEEKLTSMELEYNQLKMELEKKEKEMDALKRRSRRSSRYSGNFDKESVIQDLVEKNEEGKFIIQSLMDEVAEYRNRVEDMQEDHEKLKETLSAAEQKGELASEELAKAVKNNEEFAALKTKFAQVKEEISDLEKVSSDFVTQQSFFDNDVIAVEGRILKFTEGILLHLPDWLSRKEDQILQLETDIEKETLDSLSVKKQLSIVNVSLEKAVAQANSLHEELAQEADKFERSSTEKETMKTFYLEKISDMEKEMNSLIESHANETKSLQEKLSVAEQTSTELTSLKEQFKGLEKEANERKSFEEQLMKETDRLHGEVERLKKENLSMRRTSQKSSTDASEMLRDVEILTKDRNDLLTRVETLQKKLADNEKEKEKLLEEIRENIADKTTVQDNTELIDLRTSLLKKETEVKTLTTELDGLREECGNLQCKVKELQENEQASKEETSRELELGKNAAVKEQKNLKEENDRLQNSLKELGDVKEENASIKKEAGKQRSDLSDKLREKEIELEISQTSLAEFKHRTKEHIEKIQQDHEAVLKASKERHKTEIDQLESEETSRELELEKNAAVKEQKNLKEEIDRLRNSLKELGDVKEENATIKKEAGKQKSDLSDKLREKEIELEISQTSLAEFKHRTKEHIEKIQQDHETELKASKERHKTEIDHLESELSHAEKTVNAKEKELTSFRESRDQIVQALEVQISNEKSTIEVLKTNLDDRMAEIVQMKSQLAAAAAEGSEVKKRLEEENSRMKESLSASAMLNMDPIVQVKREPISPQMMANPVPKRQLSTKLLSTGTTNMTREVPDKAADEETLEKTTTTSRRGRGRRGGSSTGSRGSRRGKRTTTARPATPFPEVPPCDDEETVTPTKKTRSNSKEKKKSATISIKSEVTDQGVLDDSELMKETGNSQQFPQPTMELDVTPQVSKKKTRKRAVRKEEQESEDADGSVRSSTRRQTRANANSTKASDEEQPMLPPAPKNLTKMGNMLRNSPVGHALKCLEEAITPTAKSPKKGRKQQEDQQHKRTKRLVKLNPDDISYPLEATPSPDHAREGGTIPSVGETPARMIRRLRNRK